MCMSKAYLQKNGERELLLEDVSSVKAQDGKILLTTLFGEQKEVRAGIKEIDFMTHNLVLAETA